MTSAFGSVGQVCDARRWSGPPLWGVAARWRTGHPQRPSATARVPAAAPRPFGVMPARCAAAILAVTGASQKPGGPQAPGAGDAGIAALGDRPTGPGGPVSWISRVRQQDAQPNWH